MQGDRSPEKYVNKITGGTLLTSMQVVFNCMCEGMLRELILSDPISARVYISGVVTLFEETQNFKRMTMEIIPNLKSCTLRRYWRSENYPHYGKKRVGKLIMMFKE